MLPYVRPYTGRLAAAAAALTLGAATVVGLGKGLELLVDRGFSEDNAALLDQALLVLLGVIVLLAAASFVRFYMVSWIGERVVADLRRDVYSRVIRLHVGFYETNRTAEIISRLTADTTVLQVAVGTSVSIFLRNLLTFLGGTVMLLVTSPKLTGLVALVVPVVLVTIITIGRKVRRLSRAAQDRVADVGAYVDETLHGIRTVQAHAHEPLEERRFFTRVEDAFSTAVDRVRARATMTALVILTVFAAVGVILWVGGHDVLAGRITGGELSAFVFYSVLVAAAVGAMSEIASDLQRAAGAAERLFDLLDTEPEIAAPARPLALPEPARGAIAFDSVTFRYPSRPDESALDRFSLSVVPGRSLALVGPSGAGKTTVFQLLLRFYDPQAGTVRLDGVDIRRADPHAVRARIALVPQDPVIFSGSAFDNIRYGRPDATPDEVRRAARAAHALEFIEAMPEGFDTHLGERGVRLSGGQKQRIALARAILRDPAVLLLDEATSALDAESERMVQMALAEVMRDRTTIVIAHRLATVQNVDRIAVLDRGRLVATGTHGELIRQGGLYARLAALQFDSPDEGRRRAAAGE
jgi:ATP-binding cassette subfamily B protein